MHETMQLSSQNAFWEETETNNWFNPNLNTTVSQRITNSLLLHHYLQGNKSSANLIIGTYKTVS